MFYEIVQKIKVARFFIDTWCGCFIIGYQSYHGFAAVCHIL